MARSCHYAVRKRTIIALAILIILVVNPTTRGQTLFREDFNDSDIILEATGHVGSREVEDGSYVIAPNVDERSFGSVTSDAPLADYSIKSQFRSMGVPSGTGYFILLGRDTADDLFNLFFGAVSTTGDLLVGEVLQSRPNVQAQIMVDRSVPLKFDPVAEDVLLQVDFVGPVVSVFAWPESDVKPLLPQVRMRNDRLLSGDLFSLEYNPPADLTPGAFRFFEVSTVDGDFDANALVDAQDADLLASQFSSAEPDLRYDLNEDGAVTQGDLHHWVKQVVVTNLGDANLDGEVGFDDFLVLSEHFGEVGGWADGDFDGSGTIGFPDFLLLSKNYGGPALSAAVPEPNGIVFCTMGICFLLGFNRAMALRSGKTEDKAGMHE